jgi:hypothetical protein
MDLIRIERRDILNYQRRRATERDSMIIPSGKLDEARARRQLSASTDSAPKLAEVGQLIDMAPWREMWETPLTVA